jgi:hypothetical protein
MNKKRLVLISILILSVNNCDPNLPVAPVGDDCTINIEVSEAICTPINKKTYQTVVYPRGADGSYKKPLKDMNGNRCFDPLSGENVQIYINALQGMVPKK